MFLVPAGIREKFNLAPNAFGTQIDYAIASASRKLRLWVGEASFALAAGAAPSDPDEPRLHDTVVDAHSWLAMFYLSRAVAAKYSPDGVVKRQQDASSPAMGGRVVTNEHLTDAALIQSEQRYYDTAEDIARPYIIVDSTEAAVRVAANPAVVRVAADW